MGKRTKPVMFDAKLEAALNETGLPWEIEPGSKHHKIRLKGRLAGIISHRVKGGCCPILTGKNVKAVRRLAAEIAAEEEGATS